MNHQPPGRRFTKRGLLARFLFSVFLILGLMITYITILMVYHLFTGYEGSQVNWADDLEFYWVIMGWYTVILSSVFVVAYTVGELLIGPVVHRWWCVFSMLLVHFLADLITKLTSSKGTPPTLDAMTLIGLLVLPIVAAGLYARWHERWFFVSIPPGEDDVLPDTIVSQTDDPHA